MADRSTPATGTFAQTEWALTLAAIALAIVVTHMVIHRALAEVSSTVTLDTDQWRCTAAHDETRAVQRATGGVGYETASVCDAWGRR